MLEIADIYFQIPYLITQLDNWRDDVFFYDDDKQLYLEWLINWFLYQNKRKKTRQRRRS